MLLKQYAVDKFLRKLDTLESGHLQMELPNGQTYNFESGNHGAKAKIKIHDWKVISNLALKGDTGFAEDYRDGYWETEDLKSLLTLGLMNDDSMRRFINGTKSYQFIQRLGYFMRRNSIRGSRKNIHAHYDLGNDFYQLWLDPSMTYSSAIFNSSEDSLERAQMNKYDRILDRFDTPHARILEIGCGWGGFAERSSQKGFDRIKGLTISQEQYDFCKNRLGARADVILDDYRHIEGTFDHIASIEMFEAVGEEYWPTYFKKIKSLLSSSGSAVIQTITIANDKFDEYRKGSDVIRSYIFPGGMLPSANVFGQYASMQDLRVTDQYHFGLDYARTLELWLHNFELRIADIKAMGFDEGFIRMWRFYMASCIAGFRTKRIDVMQAELRHA